MADGWKLSLGLQEKLNINIVSDRKHQVESFRANTLIHCSV